MSKFTQMTFNKFRFFLVPIFFLGFFYVPEPIFAQKCLTDVKSAENIDLDRFDSLNNYTAKWIKSNAHFASRSDIITIPIVVHVIYNNEVQNISENQVLSQVEVLNEDFRKLNANLETSSGSFLDLAADTEIEFCLAKFDPNGKETNGITYTPSEVQAVGLTNFWYQSAEGGTDAWETDDYLNIWVCDLGGNGALGFAAMPGVADPKESDGIVIDYRNFGTVGSAENSQPYHLGRITTHEVGHYLNLEHLWGTGSGGCDTDDFVEDTPLQEQFSEGCPTFPSYDDCTFSGDGLNFNNFMDYTDDACMTMFTTGQKLRMLATLNGPRSSLSTSRGCTGTSSSTEVAKAPEIKIWPNPASDYLQIESNVAYVVIDVQGRKMDLNKRSNLIEVSSFVDGIYFLVGKADGKLLGKFIIAGH